MGKDEEMKQDIIITIKEWMDEYVYVENICRLYHYYDRKRDISNESKIIELTCNSVYENVIVSLAKFFVTIQSPSRFSGIRYKSHRVTELTHRKYNDYKSIFCIKSLKNNKIIVTFRGD